ncbi:MAG: hypothetical protein JXB18_07450 [Sedimentisphaerales bacterium]|nr:hypothetical protein [Sedimentisphaerales bacterium]
MSKNNDNEELFDVWLSTNLKVSPRSNPAFAKKVVQEMERLKAEKMLRQVILQERFMGGLLVLTLFAAIGLLCCPPVLRWFYTLLETAMSACIRGLMNPSLSIAAITALVLLLIVHELKSLWFTATAES